ncbi:MAG: TIGR00297 family protein [Halobacteriaceae archaeon]
MTGSLRRASAFAGVATLALTAPILGRAAPVPFALIGVLALAVTEGRLFELFARPGDRKAGRLTGLAGFAFAATGLAVVTIVGLPVDVFAAAIVLTGYGNLAVEGIRPREDHPLVRVSAFAIVGGLAALVALYLVPLLGGTALPSLPVAIFLAVSGALLGALVRAVFLAREDALVLVAVALLLWLFTDLAVAVTVQRVTLALGVTLLFGYTSYALDAASVPGMVTGVLLGVLAVVLGGFWWFAILFTFFGVGGLSTKYGYERKLERGVAEEDGGARGSGNVLGNSLAAIVALLLFAAQPRLPVGPLVFQFAFAGSVATALGDTLSSEIGGLFDGPRLLTSLEPVEPGTDGAITWQGELAGVIGTGIIGGLAALAFGSGVVGIAVTMLGGFTGMTTDSLVGATLEGERIGNQSVNFVATAAGGVAGGLLALLIL